MNIKTLKKKLFIRVSTYLAIVTGMVFFGVYISDLQSNSNKKHDLLRNDISSLNRKLEGLSKKALEFSEAIKVWENLSEEDQKLSGLKINIAKDLLDKLKEKHGLSEMNTSFSKPQEITGPKSSDTIVVISSEVNISFKGLTDENILNFVDSLLNQYPGYIQIKSFSMKRSREITKTVLERVASGNNPSLVEGKIDFTWSDLKYKGPVSSSKVG